MNPTEDVILKDGSTFFSIIMEKNLYFIIITDEITDIYKFHFFSSFSKKLSKKLSTFRSIHSSTRIRYTGFGYWNIGWRLWYLSDYCYYLVNPVVCQVEA